MEINRYEEICSPINLRVELETLPSRDVWYEFKIKGEEVLKRGILRAMDGRSLMCFDADGGSRSMLYDDVEIYKIVATSSDQYFMDMAIAFSKKCQHENSGDKKPYVGAVLVVNTRFVESAYRGEINTGEHAEFTLLRKKMHEKNRRVEVGSTLYTTLEPCTKRNPPKNPCSHWIVAEKNIVRVVIGMLDPNQNIKGEGVWRLREAGKQVAFCDHEQMVKIEELNKDFVDFYRKNV